MFLEKKFHCLTAPLVCLLLIVTGCATTSRKPADFALKFAEKDSTTYKLTTISEKSVDFEGMQVEEGKFKGGRSGNEIEMVFTQEIQGVDEKGEATAKITIEKLKYTKRIKDSVILNFDSSKKEDANNPMAKIIGQSYTIKITPDGKITKIIAGQMRVKFKSRTTENKAALELFSRQAIIDRHATAALPAKDKNQLQKNDSWRSIKGLEFGLMGPKSYEKIYTVKDIKKEKKSRIAIVEMDTIPTVKTDEKTKDKTTDYSTTFDNRETYTGKLKLNLTNGKIQEYQEELNLQWVVAEPLEDIETDRAPAVIRMSVIRSYKIEKIN